MGRRHFLRCDDPGGGKKKRKKKKKEAYLSYTHTHSYSSPLIYQENHVLFALSSVHSWYLIELWLRSHCILYCLDLINYNKLKILYRNYFNM